MALCKRKQLFPIFDTTYVAIATGNIDDDAFAIRLFEQEGFELAVCQSFAKICTFYNERIGALHIVTAGESEAAAVLSQLKILIRCNYSSPPTHGARVIALLFNDIDWRTKYVSEVVKVAQMFQKRRRMLREELERIGAKGDWAVFTDGKGACSATKLTEKQIEVLGTKHSIYMHRAGFLIFTGVRPALIPKLAAAIKDVIENH